MRKKGKEEPGGNSVRPGKGGESPAEKLEQTLRGRLMDELEHSGEKTDQEILEMIDEMILEQSRQELLTLESREKLRISVFNSVRRLDVLQELVDDPGITEIMINSWDCLFIERGGKIRRCPKSFFSRERLEDVIRQISGRCNRIVNAQRPIADARLEDGSRVNIVLPPVSLNGPMMTIRKFPKEPFTMDTLVKQDSLTEEAADFLRKLVESGYSILVGGGTSTGKTTFLNALSAMIPPDERIITIEDNAELQLLGVENLVRLEVRDANLAGDYAVTMRDLIKTALRMRPNRIIIGEVRGAEAYDWLTCLNTGHDGSLGSAHANSVRDMILRLETMVLMGIDLPVPVIRRQIASGIEILVQLVRDSRGRRMLDEIAEIEGCQNGEIEVRTLYKRDENGELQRREPLLHTEKLHRAGFSG
ncbi:MAG: CpaF family protein [Bilifractor sp.]|jgi:pilus assembly protein CpaF